MATVLTVTYMSGPHDGEVVRFVAVGDPPEVTFGRLETCTVWIANDPDISRNHARLYWNDGRWWLQDTGSLNGTYVGEFVQSKKISAPLPLEHGQIVRVG